MTIFVQIHSGEIFASINQKDGMVVFKDDPQKYNTPEMFLKIQGDITKVMTLHKQIAKKEEAIMLNALVIMSTFLVSNVKCVIFVCPLTVRKKINWPPRGRNHDVSIKIVLCVSVIN